MNGMSMVNRWGRLGMRNLTEAALDVANIIEWQRHTYLPKTREIVARLPLTRRPGTEQPLGQCPYCAVTVRMGQARCPECRGEFAGG
jgi:NMD protein affecting ribosome stability and mRNA decay